MRALSIKSWAFCVSSRLRIWLNLCVFASARFIRFILLSLLSMAEDDAKRKRFFREKYSSSGNLLFGFRAGEEVRASRALMVGDFGRELSGEDATNGVVVMFETCVDGALAQVDFDDFIG